MIIDKIPVTLTSSEIHHMISLLESAKVIELDRIYQECILTTSNQFLKVYFKINEKKQKATLRLSPAQWCICLYSLNFQDNPFNHVIDEKIKTMLPKMQLFLM
jgi:hypothetical protein